MVKERDDSIAAAFNDLRRSTAIQRLASMIALGVVTDAELSQFSPATREAATTLVDLWRPRQNRRKARSNSALPNPPLQPTSGGKIEVK